MTNNSLFDARYITRNNDHIFRVYAQGSDLFFIDLGGLGDVGRAVTAQFGLIGYLIGAHMKKKAKQKAADLLQRFEAQDLESLLRESKSSFKLYIPEISEAAIEPPAFFAMHGKQTGRLNLKTRGDQKYRFEFENADSLRAALDVLPKLLNSTLHINGEWNESKKKLEKKRT
jgi:hypothetical protein